MYNSLKSLRELLCNCEIVCPSREIAVASKSQFAVVNQANFIGVFRAVEYPSPVELMSVIKFASLIVRAENDRIAIRQKMNVAVYCVASSCGVRCFACFRFRVNQIQIIVERKSHARTRNDDAI